MPIRYVMAPVHFKIEPLKSIEFSVERMRTVLFDFTNITVTNDSHAHYDGEYVITPRVYEQTMETNDLVMDNDVTILQIPVDYVGNVKGGNTATIG